MNWRFGEPGLEHEVELDREVDGIGGEEHVIEQVAGGENHPLAGVERLVGPVEVAVVGQQVVADQQRDLGVADLIQRPRVAIVRQALSRPKRAIRSSATAPAYSARATAPLWILTS